MLYNLHKRTMITWPMYTQVQCRMKAWEQYKRDHKALLTWLADIEKEKSRLRLRYVHMRVIPSTIQKIQVIYIPIIIITINLI